MVGAILIAIVILVVLPVSFLLGGAAISAVLGHFLYKDAEVRAEDSEYVDLNT